MFRRLHEMSFRTAIKLALAWPLVVLVAVGALIGLSYVYLSIGAGKLPQPGDFTVQFHVTSWWRVIVMLLGPPAAFLVLWRTVAGRRAV